MSYMKDPSLSSIRRRRTPTLKLLVSFNGAFCRLQPYNRLRYTGGETRIISVDRNISFSKLKAKIMTDLVRPKAAVSGSEFSLKYYISETSLWGVYGKEGEAPILISLDTDDDVRSMVEDYETMEFNGMFLKRLRVFVCYDCSNYGSDNCGFVNNKLENLNSESNGFYEVKQGFAGIQGDQRLREDEGFLSEEDLLALLGKGRNYKASDNRSKKFHDDSLRKTVLRQQLLAKKFDEICIFRGLDGQSEMELAGENGDSESPLLDLRLGPESPIFVSKKMNPRRDVGRKVRDYKYLYPHKMPHEGSEKVLSVKQSNSLQLNSKDGSLRGELDGLEVGFPGHTRKIIGGNNICSLESPSEFGAAGHTSNLSHYSEPTSKSNGLEVPRVVQPLLSFKNRENIMPNFGEPGDNIAKWNQNFTPSDHNQLIDTPNPFKPGQEGYHGGIHRHKCSSSEVRSQRICQSHFKIRTNRNFGLDGKFYPWLNSKATISKQGPVLRTCVDVSSKPFTNSCYGEEVDGRDCRPNNHTKLVNLPHHGQDEIPVTTGFLGDLKHESSNPGKGYIAGEDGKFPISFVAAGSLPHVKTVCTQILTGPGSDEYHIPNQSLTVNIPGEAGINGKAPSDISEGVSLRNKEDEQTAMSQNPPHLNSCHPNNPSNRGGTGLSYNYVYGETETAHGSNIYSSVYTRDDHSASLVNLSPCNLSLEMCSKLQQSAPSARIDNPHSLLTPQSKNLDLVDEQHLKSGPRVENSSDVYASSSSEKAAKMGNGDDEIQEVQRDIGADLSIQEKHKKETTEWLKANKDALPADVYTHSSTSELQNIRNSDLECIKELGSGTFGTVYHGKWKGCDVAIKRINPSCFANGAKVEDRVVADFWKEAHILGQLRHPHIVALYGVASDGPLNSLATVTEYMVNGSLKQVLRKKDRTIDRRKRLIIAMDATCGMEYLHGKNIVHFDLKSHNFLMNMRDPQRPVCKIGDLGLSKIKQSTHVSGGVRGTIPWMAPELLNGCNLVSEKVDVYSFGIVLWELLTGEEPYETMRSEEIIAGVIRGDLRPEVPSWCDPAWRSVMERCWSSDPDSRPAFSEIAKDLRAMAASTNIK